MATRTAMTMRRKLGSDQSQRRISMSAPSFGASPVWAEGGFDVGEDVAHGVGEAFGVAAAEVEVGSGEAGQGVDHAGEDVEVVGGGLDKSVDALAAGGEGLRAGGGGGRE